MKTISNARTLLDRFVEQNKAKRGKYAYKLSAEQIKEARAVWDLAIADNGGPPHGLITQLAKHYKVSNNVMIGAVSRATYRWVK